MPPLAPVRPWPRLPEPPTPRGSAPSRPTTPQPNAADSTNQEQQGLRFPAGTDRYQAGFEGEFEVLDQAGLFREMFWLLDELELENTIFRSDHASNYLVLKGVLNRDKPRLLQQVQTALERPEAAALRPEWMRGL